MNLNDPAELDRIQAVCDGATPEPWFASDILDCDRGGVVTARNEMICGYTWSWANSQFVALARTALPLSIAALRERTWKPITEMSRDDMETGMNFIFWSPKTHASPHEGRYWTQENEWRDTDGYVIKPTHFMPLPTPPQEEPAHE